MLTLDVDQRTDHLLLRLGGELDLESSRTFRDRLSELTRHAQQPTVLDLSDLQFIDSSGLAALVAMLRLPAGQRPRIVLATSEGPVSRVLRTTRLDALLGVHPSVGDALGSPAAAGSAA